MKHELKYVLLSENGQVHSVWSSPKLLLDSIDQFSPSAFDPDTWMIVSAAVDKWQMAMTNSVAYVREAIRISDGID